MKSASLRKYRSLILSLAISGTCLLYGMIAAGNLDTQTMVSKLLWPLGRLMGLISIGLIAGQAIEAAGWTGRLGALAGPLFRFARLSSRCSAAFTTAFLSGVAANAMLVGFYKDHAITRRQLFLTNFINQFPAYFLHLPTTFFIVLPLTGRAGVLYFVLTFAAAVFRTFLLLVYGRLFPGEPSEKDRFAESDQEVRPVSGKQAGVFAGIREKIPGRIAGIAVTVVPIYIFVFVINSLGFFGAVRTWLARYVATTFMPIEALSMVVVSFAAEFTSGFAAAGALQNAGVLTMKQTVLALLIGNIVAFPVRALRHQLPRYVGIFSPKTGTQLLLMGQGLRVASLLSVGVLYYYLCPQ